MMPINNAVIVLFVKDLLLLADLKKEKVALKKCVIYVKTALVKVIKIIMNVGYIIIPIIFLKNNMKINILFGISLINLTK